MTKLEELNISGVATASDWHRIAKLPNLLNFAAEVDNFTEEFGEALQKFSQLTKLDLCANTPASSKPPDIFSLTNLRDLQYISSDNIAISFNFSPLVHVTKLVCCFPRSLELISLPRNLKEISVYSIPPHWSSVDILFDRLCHATNLEKIELYSQSKVIAEHLTNLQNGIGRLVHLQSLTVNFKLGNGRPFTHF